MYKVLIADDEDIICRGLVSMVSACEGMEVVAVAEDGEIALEKARECLPDLLIVDINMPFLNGLEFVEKVHGFLPDVAIIIVTGYENFEFVQKALQLGVTDYVLKPVMEDAFFDALKKATDMLDNRDSSRNYIHWMEGQMERNRDKMVDDLFDGWLRGRMGDEEVEKQMGYLKIKMPVPYRVAIMYIYRNYERECGGNMEGVPPYDKCCEIVKKCFAPYTETICFQTEEGALAVITDSLIEEKWDRVERELVSALDADLCAKMEYTWERGDHVFDFPAVFSRAMRMYKESVHYSDTVRRTIEIINKQWGDSSLSLLSVADLLFVSAPYLSKLFRRETGENFAAYLTRKRISEAKTMLKNTNMKMYEIAQKTGYTSQHYFSNAFKKHMEMSPVDYRKTFRKEETDNEI